MKIWIKVLVGIIIGLLLGIFLPMSEKNLEIFGFLSQFIIRIGRYVVFPLIFFSLVIGTFELKREKKLFSVYSRSILYLVFSAVLLVVIGILSVLLFSPERLPIIVEEERAIHLPGVKETLLNLFPENLFQVLVGSGSVLLPIIVLAFLLGINLNFDLRKTNPTIQLADSLNRIFYHINSLLMELFGFALLVISAYFIMNMRNQDLTHFKQIFIILGIDFTLVVFIIYPGLLYLFGGKRNPYKWLYAVIAPALTAFFTGDEYLSIGMLVKNGKENLGVPRRIGSAVYPGCYTCSSRLEE